VVRGLGWQFANDFAIEEYLSIIVIEHLSLPEHIRPHDTHATPHLLELISLVADHFFVPANFQFVILRGPPNFCTRSFRAVSSDFFGEDLVTLPSKIC